MVYYVIYIKCFVYKGSVNDYNEYKIGNTNLLNSIENYLDTYNDKFIDVSLIRKTSDDTTELTYQLVIELDTYNKQNSEPIQNFVNKVFNGIIDNYKKYNALYSVITNISTGHVNKPNEVDDNYHITIALKDIPKPNPPIPSFKINYDPNKFPTDIKIVDESKNSVKYQYDFGDGEKSFLKEPNKTYTTEGTYNIVLTTLSSDNLSATYTQTITIKKPVDPIVESTTQDTLPDSADTNPQNQVDKTANVNETKPDEQATNIKIQTPNDPDYQSEFIRGSGFSPVIYYNSLLIDNSTIDYFSLYNDGFIPCIKLNFRDSSGTIKSKGFPLDDTKIKIFISSRSNNLKSIILDFSIMNFNNNDGSMMIDGILQSSKLYNKGYKNYSDSTSYKALKQICTDIGIGFNSNITDSNDTMNWLQNGERFLDFIESIVERSYISDKTFLAGYIDYYQCFNYIDIEKEMDRDITDQHGINTTGLESANDNSAKIDVQPLVLTNDESMLQSNNYFSKFKIINRSAEISAETGYIQNTAFYDRNKKQLVSFKIDSITKNENSKIILKGDPSDPNSTDNVNNNQNHHYLGKLDTSNVHDNYFYTKINNWKNITDLGKIEINIEMSNPNFNLYQFQKVNLILSNKSPMGGDDSMTNTRLSGEWLLIGIEYVYSNNTFIQNFRLIKRELELSKEELEAEKNNTNTNYKKEVAENTQNPEPNEQTTGSPALVDYSNTQAGANNIPIVPPTNGKYLKASGTNEDIFYYISNFIEGGYTWDCRIDIQALGLGTYDPKRLPFPPNQFRRPVPRNSKGNPYNGIGSFNNSGETIYGIDRSNNDGGKEDKDNFNKLWNLVDAYKVANLPGQKVSFMTCNWEYNPPNNCPFTPLAKKYSFNFMYNRYLKYSKIYFNSSQITFLEKDARLRFHFIYAGYNGYTFFKNFAHSYLRHLTQTQNYDQLVRLCLLDRINYGNHLIAQGGGNIKNKVFGPQYA